MNEEEKAKRKLLNALKLNGFTVRREFCSSIITSFLEEGIDLDDKIIFDNLISNLCNSLSEQCLVEKSIEKEHIEKAIQICLNHGYDNRESVFNVINAFDFPKLSYNQDRKQYYLEPKKSVILPEPNIKGVLFAKRYETVLQRTKRAFRQSGDLELQTIDYLITLSKKTLDRTLILGFLFHVSEGKWCLEDPTGMVELNLIHAKFHVGFFVENSLVLVNGYYENKILHVSSVVLPPGEDYKTSKPSFGNINYFGGFSNVPLRDSASLRNCMVENRNKIMLFFSDVWLDHPQVFDKLEALFNGFQDFPPIAFVFMGNFMSNSHGSELMDILKKLFKKLAQLILKFPEISSTSQFVFVPGMNDPCTPHMVPRFGLPDYITSDMKQLLPNAIFATNPCRIQYCTREIVIFRADLTSKLLQSTLHKPSKEDLSDCLKRTIISQGHLSPLPLNSLPVHWDFDYCLRLFPLPDLVIIGDKNEMYNGDYKDCHLGNPGPFCESGFQFLSYLPFSNSVDDCTL